MDEPQLIAKARAGDRGAAEELFAQHLGPLHAFIRARVGARSEEVEDVLQETLTSAVIALPRYRGESGFWAWLSAIARHKVADHIDRAVSQRKRMAGGTLGEERLAQVSDELGERELSIDVLTASDVQAAVLDALEALDEADRDLLIAKYRSNLSVNDIAKKSNRTAKSVEAALYRARCRFRAVFASVTRGGSTRIGDPKVSP